MPIVEHPHRFAIGNELHARPFLDITPPHRVSHFAMLSDGDGIAEVAHLVALCRRFDTAQPPENAIHFTGDFGAFRLKWERHTEFTTYTFLRPGAFKTPFEDSAVDLVPAQWLEGLPGQRVVATHLALMPAGGTLDGAAVPSNLFVEESMCRGRVLDDSAEVTTDFRIHADGYSRILVADLGVSPRQAGRLVQRLLEVETYRNMAMLSLPLAREASPLVRRIGQTLSELTAQMKNLNAVEAERSLLDELTSVSAEIEESIAQTSYRFSATKAYTTLIEERTTELGEVPVEDYSMLSAFVERRFAPAMRTCDSIAQRQQALSERATRAANLLRTRVDIKLEGQNRDLLASMDKRARLQLRLQQTVEGLSVAAITYYLVSLVAYVLGALKDANAIGSAYLWTGVSVPVIFLLISYATYRVRKKLRGDH